MYGSLILHLLLTSVYRMFVNAFKGIIYLKFRRLGQWLEFQPQRHWRVSKLYTSLVTSSLISYCYVSRFSFVLFLCSILMTGHELTFCFRCRSTTLLSFNRISVLVSIMFMFLSNRLTRQQGLEDDVSRHFVVPPDFVGLSQWHTYKWGWKGMILRPFAARVLLYESALCSHHPLI